MRLSACTEILEVFARFLRRIFNSHYMFEKDVKLSAYSNYKIGGTASYFFEAVSVNDIVEALKHWGKIKDSEKNIFILGGGTNLLINDSGFSGLVIKTAMKNIHREGENIRAGAGVLMNDLLEFASEEGLSGLEWAGGLPGTLGGAIRGNAGAFGGEIKDSVLEVLSLNTSGGGSKIVKRDKSGCLFSYRDSIFKQRNGQEIILEAALALKAGDKSAIKDAILEKINFRHTRHPMDYPNIGSIFKNVDYCKFKKLWQRDLKHVVKADPFPVVPTAYLLSECGLKGVAFGGAMISPKHPNFIVNVLSASSEDVKSLIELAKFEVSKKFGILLEEEIIYL